MAGPLQFPLNVPIVGQPYTLLGGFLTAMIVCHCGGARVEVLISGHVPGVCPSCGRQYVIQRGEVNNETGQIGCVIGMATPKSTLQ